MTKKELHKYKSPELLRTVLRALSGGKFRLDCGHHITFNTALGNDLVIRNGKKLTITCSLCG